MTHPHAAPEPSPSDGPFIRSFLVTLLALVALVVAVVFAVDPVGRFGTGLLPPAVSADRDQKAALLRALPASPRIVILGSSRSKTLAPACVAALGGGPAFNFAVNGAATQDLVAIGRYLRARGPGTGMLLLVGVEPELLQPGAGPHRPLTLSRSLAPLLPEEAAASDATLAADLLGWQALQGALQSLLAALRAPAGLPETALDPDGRQRYPRIEAARAAETFDASAAVRGSLPGILARYESFGRLDPMRVSWLRQFLREARADRRQVIAFIPPVHPDFARAAAGTAWRKRTEETVLLLRGLEREGLLRYVPVEGVVDSVLAGDYVDGIHFLAPVAARVVQRLLGAPEPCALQ